MFHFPNELEGLWKNYEKILNTKKLTANSKMKLNHAYNDVNNNRILILASKICSMNGYFCSYHWHTNADIRKEDAYIYVLLKERLWLGKI